MKKLLVIMLCLSLLLTVGCAAKTEIAEDPATVDEAAAPAEEAPAAAAKESYKWDDMRFELQEITEDLGTWGSQLVTPKGKYVMVVFKITDGKMECGRLEDLVMNQGILLKEYEPATVVAQGVAIEDNKAVAVGTIHVFFDVPADMEPKETDVRVLKSTEAEAASGGQQTIPLTEGSSFDWRGYHVTVVKTDTGGFSNGTFTFQPEGMTDNDYCFDLYLDVGDELKDNEELRKALYEAAILVDEDGKSYSPKSSLMPSEGADLVFMYAIPNSVPEETLKLAPTD